MKLKTLIKEKSSKSRDPYLLFFHGLYYYCFSRDNKIYLSYAKNLDELEKAKECIVYPNEEGYQNLWAPELHIIDNRCYIYVACDDGTNENHRMYVLYNDSNNPLKEYKNYGIISDASNKWAIDGTILHHNNELYFIWSGCENNIHYKQELFIAKMNDPFHICSKKVLISSPEYDWEKQGGDGINLPYVNEGPAILRRNEKIYVIYSASGCWCKDYCLGCLELTSNDPLSQSAWKKYKFPVFSNKNSVIGPGHCSFAYDQNDIIMAFHCFLDENDVHLNHVNAKYIKATLK